MFLHVKNMCLKSAPPRDCDRFDFYFLHLRCAKMTLFLVKCGEQ